MGSFQLARVLLGLGGFVVLIFLWWVGTDVLAAPGNFVRNFSPTNAFIGLGDLLGSSDLPIHVYVSLKRILIALAFALLVGVPTGLATRQLGLAGGRHHASLPVSSV